VNGNFHRQGRKDREENPIKACLQTRIVILNEVKNPQLDGIEARSELSLDSSLRSE
jgi:hypothetical protein